MYLLFDIGGTKTRLAVARDNKDIGEVVVVKTSPHFSQCLHVIEKAARELAGKEHISAVCGGIAGPVNKKEGILVNSPNLPGWIKTPLGAQLTRLFSAPVFIENDAALVGLGEAHYGAGKGYDIVAYITISTGVGGVRIVDGYIDRNAMGFEAGHQIIRCDDGKEKTLEALISGARLKKRYDKDPKDIYDAKVWEQAARLLACGVNNTIVYWSPDIVVLGGSLIRPSAISIERVRKHVGQLLNIFPHPPPLTEARLGDIGGLYGALIYVRQHGKDINKNKKNQSNGHFRKNP